MNMSERTATKKTNNLFYKIERILYRYNFFTIVKISFNISIEVFYDTRYIKIFFHRNLLR